ncbi:hypothetical protein BDL97_16G017700 [Sphagnum fallax]|nr:hypothetical protein BDL97_16G017700 [Sphagnum fallax]
MDPSTSTALPAGPSFSPITPLGSPQMSSHTQQAQAEPIQQQQQDDDLFVPGIGEPDDLLERIEPPSEAPIWPSLAAAMADLNAFTGPNGWALTSFRTEKKKDEVVMVFLHCDRGGTYRSRVNEDFRRRGTASRQVGCPFDAVLRHFVAFGGWKLRICNADHNHGPTPPITHPSLRRAAMKEHNDEIRTKARTGLQNTKIMRRLREQDPDIPIFTRDILNDRQHQRIKFLPGRTPIQALLYTLQDDGDCVYQYQTDDNDKVTALFFSHRQCLELLHSNPFFLVMDCTYKTNKYKMPLLQIIGSTAIGSMFFVAFCFLSSETVESYGFALRCLKSMYQSIDLQLETMLKSVFTDKDDALSAAILAHLPFVYHFLCIWHINMNVMKKCKPIFRQQLDNELGDEEIGDNQYKAGVDERWKAFLQFWNAVIGATTEDAFAATWIALQGAIPEPEFATTIAYLENEWLRHKEKFVHAWTDHHLHFGHRATSKAEGAHALIKRELMVSTNDVVTVVNALVRTLKDQHVARKATLECAKVNLPIKLLIPLFGDVVGKVAPQALHRMLDIRNK